MVRPEWLVDEAVKMGVNMLCITDHDTVEGSLIAKDYAEVKYPGLINIITGAEYYTEWGDIIVLGIKEEIQFINASDLILKSRKIGAVVLLPHPYKGHKEIEHLASLVDGIEVFNGRCDEEDNIKAMDLANRWNKFKYVASDSHFKSNFTDCINISHAIQSDDIKSILENIILDESKTTYASKKSIHLSQAIKGMKQKNIKLFYDSLIQYVKS
jgi:predicted metal-dependent phosphoesterase TrpH